MEREPLHRIVLDTNTIVSAYLFPLSNPGKALGFVISRGRLLMSLETATELPAVMRREKFDRYLRLQIREELVASSIRDSEFVATTTVVTVCRDAADNRVLELAVDGSASAIVSGDADRLALQSFRGIPLMTASEFLSRFSSL
jgi:putative PIN family toxin of toxin-antitoxin system